MSEIINSKNGVPIDIDAIVTDLNGKADKDLANCTAPYITETYSSGTDWYRIYSDGWCEQGGRLTASGSSGTIVVSLLQNYRDANYTIIAEAIQSSSSGNGGHSIDDTAITVSSFEFQWNAMGLTGIYWRTAGYIS